jgi:hypothetical protein
MAERVLEEFDYFLRAQLLVVRLPGAGIGFMHLKYVFGQIATNDNRVVQNKLHRINDRAT